MRAVGVLPILAIAAAAFALASPATEGGWSQPGGGPGHSGVGQVPNVLDVLGSASLVPEGFEATAPLSVLADTPAGLLGLAYRRAGEAQECTLALVRGHADAVAVGEPFLCGADPEAPDSAQPFELRPLPLLPRLLAYDADRDQAIVCTPGSAVDPVLRILAVSTGETLFAQSALDLGASVQDARSTWSCSDAAVQDDILYVGLSAQAGDCRLLGIELDGPRIRFARTVPLVKVREIAIPDAPASGQSIVSVTANERGLLLLTRTQEVVGGQPPPSPPAGRSIGYILADFNGTMTYGGNREVLEAALASGTPLQAVDDVPKAYSRHAATRNNQMAFVAGNMLLILDPAVPDQNYLRLPPGIDGVNSFEMQPAPAWDRDTLVAPRDWDLYIVSAEQRDVTSLNFRGNQAGEVLLDPDGGLLALWLQARAEPGYDIYLVQYDVTTSRAKQMLAVGQSMAPARQVASQYSHLAPFGDGLVVWHDGAAASAQFLGPSPAARRPQLALPDLYPSLDAVSALSVQVQGGAVAFDVAWGDGILESYTAGEAPQHAYRLAGTKEVRVTSRFADGTTATATLAVHPGMPPPADLNFMQRAFAPEYQNWTFFILGLLVTVVGAILAIVARRRSQSRIHAELATLDQIAAQGKADSVEARRDLDDFERDLRKRLASGSLRDTQYDILDRRARDVRRDLS